ncbi:hypothetical protein OQA88_1873 [Cercophora sp. LCS_1]
MVFSFPYSIGLLVAALAYLVTKVISYRRHPLSKFPGPFLCAITNLPYSYHIFAGDHPKWVASLHEKYGPVVRLAPSELSFTTPTSWRDIYGFRKDHGVFIKSAAYDAAAFTDQARSIVNERDPAEHAKMRKMLAPAFSDRSLRLQWPLINQIVNDFIAELAKKATSKQEVDMTLYLSLVSFDIATSLALGESFGSVAAGRIHPWATFFRNGAQAMGEGVAVMRFPWLGKLLLALKPPQMVAMIKELGMHEAMCIEMVKKRLDSPSDRPDILGLILQAGEKEGNSFTTESIAAQLSDVVIAGTETSITALTTANHFVMRDPAVMRKLRAEIRGRFKSYEEISCSSTADLEYLNAVLNEAMRLLAPVAWLPSRVVPPGGDTVDGYHLPAGTWVATSYYAAATYSANFKDAAEFRPERWIGQSGDALEASQPFGVGTRACIGKGVALTKLRLIMAKLHYKFDMEAVEKDLDWIDKAKFRLLWAKPPLVVKLTERT